MGQQVEACYLEIWLWSLFFLGGGGGGGGGGEGQGACEGGRERLSVKNCTYRC